MKGIKRFLDKTLYNKHMSDITEKSGLPKSEISVTDLKAVLKNVHEVGYAPNRGRQEAVFAQLPGDVVEQLYGELRAAYIEQSTYQSDTGKYKEIDMRAQFRGEVFEMLVENDPIINPTSGLSVELAAVTEELLSLTHNPGRFNLQDEIGYIRNPDLARIEVTDDGKLHIKTIGEVKLGLLNERCIQQLRETGFRRSLRIVAEKMNEKRSVAVNGLVELQKYSDRTIESGGPSDGFIVVDADVKQELYVPADRKVENLNRLIHLRGAARAEGKAVLEKEVVIKKAAFSVDEVTALTDYFWEKIVERYGE